MDKTSIRNDIKQSIKEALRVNQLPMTDIDVIGKLYRQEFQNICEEIEQCMELYVPSDTDPVIRTRVQALWTSMTHCLLKENDNDIFAVCETITRAKFTDKNESQRMLQLTVMNLAGHLDDKPWWVKLFSKKEPSWSERALAAFDVSEKPTEQKHVVTDSGLLTTSNV